MQVDMIEKSEDYSLYLLIPCSITFYTMGVGKISHRTLNCLQGRTLLQTFKIGSKKLVKVASGNHLQRKVSLDAFSTFNLI